MTNNPSSKVSAPEMYISSLLSRDVPYIVQILGNEFVIRDHATYPPGNLTRMFGDFIVESKITSGKVVADIGMGSFALGIIASQNRAKQVIGSDFTVASLDIARSNIIHNKVDDKIISMYQGDSVYALLPEFEGKVDIIFSGSPWDTMSEAEFSRISEKRKALSYSFYDIDNRLIKGLMSDGFKLLSKGGKIFITSAMSHIGRIEKLCSVYNLKYKVAKEEDIHQDGNIHYILELLKV